MDEEEKFSMNLRIGIQALRNEVFLRKEMTELIKSVLDYCSSNISDEDGSNDTQPLIDAASRAVDALTNTKFAGDTDDAAE